ncbi:hypothetical protein DIS24_g5517 [Lasiodiplodia hormozganensis]|uniref:Uncharacterized protein n=1 Tax=Lasiodiplodia hormozganensis TaxID=869390 RepID=A0AA39YL79_9PEZI|nr:hypothetical protein DIS24_g5517 [Lasiodiplodia hormozganensis]
MRPSSLVSAALVLVATNSSTKTLAAPIGIASQELSRDNLHQPAYRSSQEPIIDHSPNTPTESVVLDTKEDTIESIREESAVQEDFVETIVDEVETGRLQKAEDLVLPIKASRVREHLLEDSALKVRYKDLPDGPIDDSTRWMAAKGWGKSGR